MQRFSDDLRNNNLWKHLLIFAPLCVMMLGCDWAWWMLTSALMSQYLVWVAGNAWRERW